MIVDRDKLLLAMARVCMDTKDLVRETKMPRQTVNRVLLGRSVRPATMGRIAKALGVDPGDIVSCTDRA